MSFSRKTLLVPVAMVVALTLTPMLAACGGNPIQNVIKGATGGQLDVGGTTLPADFPSDVPLVSGEIVSAGAFGSLDEGKVWNVAIRLSDASAISDIAAQLIEAGFKNIGENFSAKEGSANIFTKEPYSLLVIIAKDDKAGFIANYSVTYTKPSS